MATMNSIRDTATNQINLVSRIIESSDFSNKLFGELLSQLPEMILTYSKSGYRHEMLDVLDKYKETLYRIAAEKPVEQNPDLNTVYILGYLKAALNMMSLVGKLAEQDRNDVLPLSIIDKTANVKNILIILYDKSVISHSELAEELALKKSALTMTVRRIEQYDLIASKKYGKFKYYYLTASGKRTYEKYVSQIKAPAASYNEFVFRLLDLITISIQDEQLDHYQVVRKLTAEFPDLDMPGQDRFRLRINRLTRSLQFYGLRLTSDRYIKAGFGMAKRNEFSEPRQYVDTHEFITNDREKFVTIPFP